MNNIIYNLLVIILFIIGLLLIFSGLLYPNQKNIQNQINKISKDNIILKDNFIVLNSLSIKQKISQMIIVSGDNNELEFTNLNIGGIFLDNQKSAEDYKNLINNFQNSSKIKLFVSTDLEGAWTPFHNPKPNQIFPYFSNISDKVQAYETGLKHGELLKEIGFNINFAPVAEYTDNTYGGRTFIGSKIEIKEKIKSYINGLQINVLGTCKHYPGNSLQKNLHDESDIQIITKKDLELFQVCIQNNISSIMVSHQLALGELNSNNSPSTVSKEVISSINQDILIIADEINMQGLKLFYPNKTKLYIDLINSGNNIILDFKLNPIDLFNLLNELENQVYEKNINSDNIDNSVKKILELKGYEVV